MHENDTRIISKTLAMIDFAESLPLELITQRNHEPVYPRTIGEYIVHYTLHDLLTYEWEVDENETLMMDIESVLGVLDMGVDNPTAWRELFVISKTLSQRT